MNKTTLLLLVILLLESIGCEKGKKIKDAGVPQQTLEDSGLPPGLSPEDANKVLARVGSVVITVGDLAREIQKRNPIQRRIFESPEKKRELLNEMIRLEILAQEAEKKGYDKDPMVQMFEKQLLLRELEMELMKSIRIEDVTEEEMKKYYQEHWDDYHIPEQVRLYHILVKTETEAQKLLKILMEKKYDERFFRETAQQYSIDEETKVTGGNLGYLSPPGKRREGERVVPEEILKVAFTLTPTEPIYPKPIKTDLGYHIIRLSHKREARDINYEDVKQHIRRIVYNQKVNEARNKLIEKLRKEANIVIYEENLKKLRIKPITPESHL